MDSDEKTAGIADTSLRKTTRVAGLAYLLIIVTSLLAVAFGSFKLIVPGDHATTLTNIAANELLFRIDTVYGLIMFSSVVLLGWALYVILKTVDKNLALLALLWRLGEAIVGGLSVLGSLVVLLLLNGGGYSAVFGPEQLQSLVGLSLDAASAARSILFVFMSLGTIVFCYLFFKSRYVPRILAGFGILAFLVALVGTFASVVLPDHAGTMQIALHAPATLFEVAIGLWLLIKGVNVEWWRKRALKEKTR
jgi:hypothetical protein